MKTKQAKKTQTTERTNMTYISYIVEHKHTTGTYSSCSLNLVAYISHVYVFLTNSKLLRNKSVYSSHRNTVRACLEGQKVIGD